MLGSGHLRPFRGNLSPRRPRRHKCGIFHRERVTADRRFGKVEERRVASPLVRFTPGML
jgi:hypothetical protein